MDQVLLTSSDKGVQKSQTGTLNFSKEKIVISVFVFLAFLLRFIFLPQNTVINGDGVYYATLGKKLVSGDLYGGISGYWSPLYSLLIGITSLIFNDLEFSGRIVSVIAGSILIIPSYLLIRNIYGRTCAYFGIVLLTIHPSLIKSSGWVMTESVYTLIFITGILSVWYSLRDCKYKYFFISGLIFSLAYLTKPEAIGFIGLLLILSIGVIFFRKKISVRRVLTGYLLILCGFSVFFLPYVIFLHYKTGHWTISQKMMVNFPAADFDGNLLKIINNGQSTMQDQIWGDHYETTISETSKTENHKVTTTTPNSFWTKIITTVSILGEKGIILLKKQIKDYLPELLPYFFILLVVISFFHKPWTKPRTANELFLFSFFFATLIGYALSAVELRYLFTLIPILICWSAYGIIGFSDWVTNTLLNLTQLKVKPRDVQIFTLLLMCAMLVIKYPNQFKSDDIKNVPFEEKQAGLWIKNNSNISSPVVMSMHATAAFYAGAKHFFIPDEDFPTILQYARNKKINFLILSQRRISDTPKDFPTDGQNLPQDLRVVYINEENPDYKIVVFQLSS